jgi:hypothetical protein
MFVVAYNKGLCNQTKHIDSIYLKILMCIWEKQSFIILILPSLSPNPMKYIMLQFLWILKFECVLEISYRYGVGVIHMNLSLEYHNDQTLKAYKHQQEFKGNT